ncbi:uncharacterized protein LOC113871751 [Abrus precatorius]|uniref:Uncharacterized protein LOC113871751 n=1 Tax=Abrus precatorius TaxID=3816 RepID=A0A8B8MA13_ABRPR|nr:uncharacterized protein LOC113871751 [Abrus precatorius]
MIKIERGITFEMFKRKIQTKLKLSSCHVISRLIARILVGINGRYHTALDVCDDEDIDCMISACQQQHHRNVVEIHVDVAVGETSSVVARPLKVNLSLSHIHGSDDDDYATREDTETDDDCDSMINIEGIVRVSSTQQQQQGEATLPFWNISPHYSYINWEHPDQELDFVGMNDAQSWKEGDALYVGQLFDTKEDVRMAVKHYAMRKHQTFFVVESKATTYVVKCVNHNSGCPWRVRASLPKNADKWKIIKWGGAHTCVNVSISQDHQKLDSKFICSCILGMVKEEPSVPISLIQERISGQFGYSISYKKAWKAKQKAIVTVFGDWDESYVDGTFLYGKYRQTLLIATTQDGNNCVLPIAFAIVEGETLSAWEWFLAMIRIHVTNKAGLCLISDRHQSIKGAVSNPHLGWQPPNTYHVYCIRHIASNFNRQFKNTMLKKKLIQLGYTPSKQIFESKLNTFRSQSPEIQTWIDNISKEKWSLAYDDEGRRYGHMTTNLSESVNKVLKGARNLPITALVKATYARLVEYFVKRGETAMHEVNNGGRYYQKLMEAIEKNQQEASSHQVRRYDIQRTRFEVEEAFNPVTQRGGHKWTVILSTRYCECGKFKALRYPCSYVIAVCAHISIDFWQFVDPVYTLHNVVNAYSSQWWPLGNENNILQNTEWKLVPDVERVRGKGRPKATRIRNEMDWVESQPRQRCRLCRQPGHNQRQYPQQNDRNHHHV